MPAGSFPSVGLGTMFCWYTWGTCCRGSGVNRSKWKSGQRIHLPWPKDRVLVVLRRWRSVRNAEKEEERLSQYLCCPEKLHFVGSICTKAFLKHREGTPPSELYVGQSGNVYLYVDVVYSDALTWIADDIDDFLVHGLRRCSFMVVPNANVLRKKETRRLVICENLNDLCEWRNAHASSLMRLGDGNMLCVSLPTSFSRLDLYYWRRIVGTTKVEPVGRIAIADRLISIFADSYLRMYATTENGVCVVADTVMEFAMRGLVRYRWSTVFYGDKKMRKLSGNLVCPYGKTHIYERKSICRRSQRISCSSTHFAT
ncbi:tegument protein UL23 [macacine betaherpesvirus 3]|uniref:Rh40 n=1 Tax=Rhesus cytomegalovirus (strain 68-1) TaxID=47929 RepID=Q2FAT0_RHCM6|nr:rh40 [macacine betaherpesvirus 3]AAP50567.1 rh40 [macacine betaherpesvirus 3]QMS44085.1 Rh40 [synthetic construct]AAZ80539.1 rhUL23 [macacine betaherpesvirus 3]AFL03513.1 Rh40 [macacine betaherpesvirus 3]APT39947.1 Rh40 [macacine betaherpesvirus 3]